MARARALHWEDRTGQDRRRLCGLVETADSGSYVTVSKPNRNPRLLTTNHHNFTMTPTAGSTRGDENGGKETKRKNDRSEEEETDRKKKRKQETSSSASLGLDDDGNPSSPTQPIRDASPWSSSTAVPLPPELQSVDFSQRIQWGKYQPYTDSPMEFVPEDTAPIFTKASPALCHYVHAISHRARACTMHLKQQTGQETQPSRPVPTPIFMPVGTKGCLKGVTMEELLTDPALQCPIFLGNTYHLAIQPGTELIDEMAGLHAFQGFDRTDGKLSYNLLTDSGGYQMVSLVKLSQVTEDGVSFENPFKSKKKYNKNLEMTSAVSFATETASSSSSLSVSAPSLDLLMLRPEDSIRHQNNISANIIMALDDVISSVEVDQDRFVLATYRTLRWFDRCIQAHAKADTQNLFPIVQGGLDTSLGGLREQCLAGFRHRDENLGYQIPGYAIGGLAGGEGKDAFWKVVDQCCRALPDNKPRYLMGVGYPLDLLVCTALGVDMYDCVFPTRTARFGVCLVPGVSPGMIRLKNHEFSFDKTVIQKGCRCQPCREGITRSRLHALLKASNPLAAQLITQHNIAYMMSLVRDMRKSILENRFAEFAIEFVKDQFPGKANGGEDVPTWVIEALAATGIEVPK